MTGDWRIRLCYATGTVFLFDLHPITNAHAQIDRYACTLVTASVWARVRCAHVMWAVTTHNAPPTILREMRQQQAPRLTLPLSVPGGVVGQVGSRRPSEVSNFRSCFNRRHFQALRVISIIPAPMSDVASVAAAIKKPNQT